MYFSDVQHIDELKDIEPAYKPAPRIARTNNKL